MFLGNCLLKKLLEPVYIAAPRALSLLCVDDQCWSGKCGQPKGKPTLILVK